MHRIALITSYSIALLLVACTAQSLPAPAPAALPTAVPATAALAVPTPLPARGPYIQTFDGQPDRPQPWQPADWDVTVHSRDVDTWQALEPMQAAHDPQCGAPPASHEITRYEDTVFICRDHLMTSLNTGGYGLIYLTPNRMVDFSQGEAVITFDLSTARASKRDWIDVWISPYDEHLQLALQDWLPDLNGEPRQAIHIVMGVFEGKTIFTSNIVQNFQAEQIKETNWWTGYESFLTPDAKRRDTFELRISRTHIKFGMPAYNFWWIDRDIPALGWDQGVVQFGHHSYNPTKGCDSCGPNTWHWDNISIDPALPFTIIRAEQRVVDATTASEVRFEALSPDNAHLRFAARGNDLEVSFDGGITWNAAQLQAHENTKRGGFMSYWMPIPKDIAHILFRGNPSNNLPWMVRDISIWSLEER